MECTVSSDILIEISNFLTAPEMGGILGVDNSDTVIAFCFDQEGITGKRTYFPSVKYLNQAIRDWYKKGIFFAGFIHSHPANFTNLSEPDLYFANQLKEFCGLSEILMPIYIPQTGQFYQYIV